MATTYGYGGEFSSDEDVDKLEQQPERVSKFDSHSNKPSKSQIETIISDIRAQSIDEEVKITDDFLAGILDYYKTPRGPIVDSTRNLYKKIILRQIRGEQQQDVPPTHQATNGDSNGKANSNNNNDNDFNLINKRQPMFESPSSDEDEPMPPVSEEPKYVKENHEFKSTESSEVDTNKFRKTETIELSSDEEDENSDDSSAESVKANDTATEESELDTTANIGNIEKPKANITSTPINFKVTPKRSELVALKKSASKESTKKSSTNSVQETEIQKPYRRSQRVAATRLSRSPANTSSPTVSSSGGGQVIQGVEISAEVRYSGRTMKYFATAILFGLIAYYLYQYKSDILPSIQQVTRKVNIKF